MPSLTYSLSRAHKITERLSSAITAKQSEFARALASREFAPGLASSARGILEPARMEYPRLLSQIETYGALLVQMRAQIAEANVLSGVSALLASIETRKRLLVSLDSLLSEVTGPNAPLQLEVFEESAPSLLAGAAGQASSGRYHLAPSGVSVTPISPAIAKDLNERLQAEKQAQFRASDAVSDTNGSYKITVNVPENIDSELAAILGL